MVLLKKYKYSTTNIIKYTDYVLQLVKVTKDELFLLKALVQDEVFPKYLKLHTTEHMKTAKNTQNLQQKCLTTCTVCGQMYVVWLVICS